MFVVERKSQQGVVVVTEQGAVEITALRCGGNRVKLGFTAPREIPIYREEVYQRVRNEAQPAPGVETPLSATELAALCKDLLAVVREARPDSPLVQRAEAVCENAKAKAAA